jgi:excisionase family DNA binding protein
MAEATLYDEKRARERLGGIGHTKYYALLASGELRSVQIGRRRLVPAVAIEEFIERRLAEQSAGGDAA